MFLKIISFGNIDFDFSTHVVSPMLSALKRAEDSGENKFYTTTSFPSEDWQKLILLNQEADILAPQVIHSFIAHSDYASNYPLNESTRGLFWGDLSIHIFKVILPQQLTLLRSGTRPDQAVLALLNKLIQLQDEFIKNSALRALGDILAALCEAKLADGRFVKKRILEIISLTLVSGTDNSLGFTMTESTAGYVLAKILLACNHSFEELETIFNKALSLNEDLASIQRMACALAIRAKCVELTKVKQNLLSESEIGIIMRMLGSSNYLIRSVIAQGYIEHLRVIESFEQIEKLATDLLPSTKSFLGSGIDELFDSFETANDETPDKTEPTKRRVTPRGTTEEALEEATKGLSKSLGDVYYNLMLKGVMRHPVTYDLTIEYEVQPRAFQIASLRYLQHQVSQYTVTELEKVLGEAKQITALLENAVYQLTNHYISAISHGHSIRIELVENLLTADFLKDDSFTLRFAAANLAHIYAELIFHGNNYLAASLVAEANKIGKSFNNYIDADTGQLIHAHEENGLTFEQARAKHRCSVIALSLAELHTQFDHTKKTIPSLDIRWREIPISDELGYYVEPFEPDYLEAPFLGHANLFN